MNIGCLSNDDGEGNENVPSYQNECAFFLNFHFNSLKMANIGQLRMESWRSHPSSDSEKKFNLPLCLRPPNNVAKGNLRLCSHSLYRKAHWTCKICCFSFAYWAHRRRRHRRLCRYSQDLLIYWCSVAKTPAIYLFTRCTGIRYSRFGTLINFFVSLETDIWELFRKK